MDALRGAGVQVTVLFQGWFEGIHEVMHLMSSLGDIRSAYLLYFPICYHLAPRVAARLVWAAVVGDWINMILKWVISGQRPYWWVLETQYYGDAAPPHLNQYPITCETGPGTPSGHAMGSACVWYVMVTAALESDLCTKRKPFSDHRRLCRVALWLLFWFIQINVCVSRVFVATHFPHQVILGLLGGILVAEVFGRVRLIHGARLHAHAAVCALLLLVALLVHDGAARLAHVDVDWSVELARKRCLRAEWVHVDTTPFAGLARGLGALFGLGLGLHVRDRFLTGASSEVGDEKEEEERVAAASPAFQGCCIAASLLAVHILEWIVPMPQRAGGLFCFVAFCRSVLGPVAVVAATPYCVRMLVEPLAKVKGS
ncbi:unnamed protein product [Lampetra planeri]